MKIHLFEGRTAARPGEGLPVANWGKFMVGVFDREWNWRSQVLAQLHGGDSTVARRPLLSEVGWGPRHVWVVDLQTGEGAIFAHGGLASADLSRKRIWVCVLFEAFLTWLYKQDLSTLDDLPQTVDLDVEFAFHGYRRPGMWYDRRINTLRVLPGPGICQRPWFT